MRVRLSVVAWLFMLMAIFSTASAQNTADEIYGDGPNKFSLATGSPGELGLLRVLGETFADKENTSLLWK